MRCNGFHIPVLSTIGLAALMLQAGAASASHAAVCPPNTTAGNCFNFTISATGGPAGTGHAGVKGASLIGSGQLAGGDLSAPHDAAGIGAAQGTMHFHESLNGKPISITFVLGPAPGNANGGSWASGPMITIFAAKATESNRTTCPVGSYADITFGYGKHTYVELENGESGRRCNLGLSWDGSGTSRATVHVTRS